VSFEAFTAAVFQVKFFLGGLRYVLG